MSLIWLYAAVILGVTGTKSDSGFVVKTALDGSYKVVVGGDVWLHSGATTVQAGGKHHSTGDGTLRLTGKPISNEGSDLLGSWSMLNYSYSVTGSQVDMCVKTYTHLPVAIFSQHFKGGLSGTSVGSENSVVSGFPTLQTQNISVDLGYLSYGDVFSGWSGLHAGRWSAGMVLADGMLSGPLLLFDKTGNVIIISAFSQFMAASLWFNKKDKAVSWGIMGDVQEIPAGFQYDTVLMYSDMGINQAMSAWGQLMRKWNRRDTAARDQDLSVNYIGYYTDHGSYYYHHTEPGMNYEETLLGVHKYATEFGIPYKYLQYDDWWYYEDGVGYGATIAWEPMPSVFPHGLRYIYNRTQLPVVAHSRYWSHKVVYAKQNGGKFTFLMDGGNSIPNDQSFWDYLFSSALQWGMVVYEQDFLNYQSEKIRPLYTDLSMGNQWLQQMGEAASRYGIQLQYCMALPRHLLASLQVPAVSQVRVSGDYLSSHQQYKIGHTSMFADALGLAPFKDNFWTTGKQPGNPGNSTELNPQVQAVITLLSTGPVGVGDRIGLSNVSLIHRLITADGRLLKPSKPAMPIDRQILQEAFGGSVGPTGEVWTTYSDIGRWRFGIIFSFELSHDYYIGPDDAGFGYLFGTSVVYNNEMDIARFSEKQKLLLHGCSYTDFCLHYTAPVYNCRSWNVSLLGEVSKLVPISPQRVSDITVSSSDVRVTLKGSPGERVNFAVSVSTEIWWFKCVMSNYGTAKLSVADQSCQ